MLRALAGCTLPAVVALAFAAPSEASVLRPTSTGMGEGYVLFDSAGESSRAVIAFDAGSQSTLVTDQAGMDAPMGPPAGLLPPGGMRSCEVLSVTAQRCPGVVSTALLGAGDDRLEVRGDAFPGTQLIEDVRVEDGSRAVPVPNGVLVHGGAGSDTLIGGTGFDRLYGGDVDSDRGSGDDVLRGGPVEDYLVGGDGDDIVDGGAGNDELTGGRGDDRVIGGVGDDRFEVLLDGDDESQGFGDDVYVAGAGDDALSDQQGSDRVSGGPGDDDLSLSHQYGGLLQGRDDRGSAAVSCGSGRDRVWVGNGDVIRGCEALAFALPCTVCSMRAELTTVGRRALTLLRRTVADTRTRSYDTLTIAGAARKALRRRASVRARLTLDDRPYRTFELRR